MAANTSRQIAANINALLGLAGWSQVQLAAATGIAQATISRKLRSLADWSISDLDRIADALSVTVAELVGTIPPAEEWDRRRRPAPVPAAPGPRFLLMPDAHADGLAFVRPLATPTDLTVTYRHSTNESCIRCENSRLATI